MRKAGRLLLVSLICLSCASCAMARRSVDRHALRDVGMDLEKTVAVMEQRGYHCSQNSFTANELSFFNQQRMSPLKTTCHRQASGLFCVESDFVDLFSQDGKVVNGRAQTVPTCIWN